MSQTQPAGDRSIESYLPIMSLYNGLVDRMRTGKQSWTWPIRIAGIVGLLATVYLIILYHPQIQRAPIPYTIHREPALSRPAKLLKPLAYDHALEGHIEHLREIERWHPPTGMKVVGLVFYGRRRFVSVLNCYLQVGRQLQMLECILLIQSRDRETWLRTGESLTSFYSS